MIASAVSVARILAEVAVTRHRLRFADMAPRLGLMLGGLTAPRGHDVPARLSGGRRGRSPRTTRRT